MSINLPHDAIVRQQEYAYNNPLKYRDENGDGGWDVIQGAVDAFVDDANPFSNQSANSKPANQLHYQVGQVIGHVGAALTGGYEIIKGGGAAIGGTTIAATTSATGIGAVAGTGIAISGVALAGHGTMMTFNAAKNMAGMKQKVDNASNKPSSQTSSGKPTDKYGNKLGPSGKPQVNVVKHPTQKSAKDAARQEGKKAPIKHTTPQKGDNHYHPTNSNSQKKPNSTHHEY